MKRNFFDTEFITYAGCRAQIPRILRYVVENRDVLIRQDEMYALVHSIKTILKNPMAEAFDRLVSNGQLRNFAAVYLKSTETAVPEMIAQQTLTLDLKQIEEGQTVLSSIPEFYNKILVDLTTAVRPDRASGTLQVTAADIIQNLIVRGHLVASYYDLDNWLSPYLSEYMIRTYSMTVGSVIGRKYNLSLVEQMKVMGIMALFMSQKLMTSDDDNLTYPRMFNRCTFLGSRYELQQLADECAEKSSKGLTLTSVCELIGLTGPEKLKSLKLPVLNQICRGIGPDMITTMIALEYPPYWLYILLSALSGTKTPLIYYLTANKLAQEGRTTFITQFLGNENFFNLSR